MGDAVYEIYVRRHLLYKGGTKAHALHKTATQYVSAKAQAKILQVLVEEEHLTEKELDMMRRGRNAKSHTSPKNTDIQIYRMSTGFESVLGYLYLNNETKRLEELIEKAFQILEGNEGDS